jgi:hypothetical protein
VNPSAHPCDREDLRISLGALALDALDPAEARDVRRHLAACPDCQAEYESFVGVRAVLDAGLAANPAVAPDLVTTPAIPTPTRTGATTRPPTRSRRLGILAGAPRRRFAQFGAVAASLALTVTAFFVGAATQGSRTATPTIGPSPSATSALPAARQLPAVTNAAGVTAAVSYRSFAWGTWVGVRMTDVPGGYVCKLTAYGRDGSEATVSSWKAVPGQSTVTVNGSVSMDAKAIDHFSVEVSGQDYDNITIPMTS